MRELATARAASEELESCWQSSGPLSMQADSFGWGALWVAVGAFFTGLFAWIVQRAKGGSDRDVAVIAQWEKLTVALTARIEVLESKVRDLEKENAGLLASIRQNSQSAAHLIGDLKGAADAE